LPNLFRRALDQILTRHEALRSTFTVENDVPVQRIIPVGARSFTLSEDDIRQHEDQQSALDRLINIGINDPFDLQNGPVVRGRLIQQVDQRYTLLITMHHIVSDGWSTEVFLRELGGSEALSKMSPALLVIGPVR
jgi:hypothetical protein